MPPHFFNALRFDSAALLLIFIALLSNRKWHLKTAISGLLLGLVLFSGYSLQSIGLQYTSATNSAFLTGLSVIFVPLFAFFVWGEKLKPKVSVGVALSSLGLFFLSGGFHFALNKGDWFTLGCAVGFAFQILAVSSLARSSDPLILSVFQLLGVAIASHLSHFALEASSPIPRDPIAWTCILFMGVFASAFALGVQIFAQRSISAVKASLVFATEPIWGAVAGFALGGDRLGLVNYFGGLLLIAGILIVESPPLPKSLRFKIRPQ